jgi:hypothetical protein
MARTTNSSSSNFQELPNQIQGGLPIFNLQTFTGSQDSSHDSQQINLDNSQQPASTFDLAKLYDALEHPLKILSQSQEALVNQCKSLSNAVEDIQLNQNSSLMNAGTGTLPPKSVPSKSAPSLRNLLHTGDTRV